MIFDIDDMTHFLTNILSLIELCYDFFLAECSNIFFLRELSHVIFVGILYWVVLKHVLISVSSFLERI